MSSPLQIFLRQAAPADWPAISALLSVQQLPLDGAREHLGHFLLAERGETLLGCAGIERYGDIGLLRSVAVAPGQQHQGLGGRLLATLLAEARRRGLRQLYLLTTTAERYFERLGFVPVERAALPAALQASAELRGACPASARAMLLQLAEPAAARPGPPAELPVAVLGAGPVGLAAAAHLLERGLQPLILEAGASVGAHLLDYGHVRLFSPWRFNLDAAMARQLRAAGGWQAPPEEALPLAREVVEQVLRPYAALPAVAAALRLSTRALAISREGFDKVRTADREQAPFLIRARQADGSEIELRARAVIDATGTWGRPNPAGAAGLPARGEAALAARIAYGMPDVLGGQRARYAGRRTLVVGAGHSAANTLLDLAELALQVPGTLLAWATRGPAPERVFGGDERDGLPARGRLGSALQALHETGRLEYFGGLRIAALREEQGRLTVEGQDRILSGFDELIVATGQRPELELTRELRLRLDPWLESTEALGPLIDPNLHSCGTVRPHGHRELSHPEPGFYTLGVKSYGRAPTFLMATGFEQARSVAAALAGDLAAADRVELQLPETGVCSAGVAPVARPGGRPIPGLVVRSACYG
jgi:N-acetylglutamate synthase-like GNAT family acetyltransferase/NADPH-dependent 2,4-dienoyl-CoA reductase/sulfur reductase-like enzyme